MTFDKFHLAAKLGEAVDAVRRTEVTTRPELKRTRWLWLKNFSHLSVKQRGELHQLMGPSAKLATARALRWRKDFQAFYAQHPSYAPDYLRRWCSGAKRSRLQPIKDFGALVEKHCDGIIAWHQDHLNNGLLEGIKSLVQAAKARAPGLPQQHQDDHHRLPHRSQAPTPHPHPSDTHPHDLTLSNPLKPAKSRSMASFHTVALVPG